METLHARTAGPVESTYGRIWKTFSFSDQFFLLHIPTSQLLQIPKYLWEHLNGQTNELGRHKLDELERKLDSVEKPKPVVVDIKAIALNVIEKCNLRCTYCYAGDGNYGADTVMSKDMAIRVVEFFSKGRDNFHIIFFGGEPLLNFSLIRDVVEWCQRQTTKFSYAVTTNGTLLAKGHLEFFKAHQFSLKLSYDGVSLQEKQRLSADKTQKLSLRVNDARLLKFKDDLAKLKGFNLRATVARDHLADFELSLLSALSAHHYAIAFARVSTADRAKMFTTDDVLALKGVLTRIVDYYLGKDDFVTLLRLINLKTHILNFHHGSIQRNFCSAGVNYLSVSTTGKFYLCHRFTEDAEACMGDIEHGLDRQRLGSITRHRAMEQEPCSSCWMRQFCGGGCFHEHKMATGSATTIDPIFCQLQDMEMKIALRIYLQLRQKASHLL